VQRRAERRAAQPKRGAGDENAVHERAAQSSCIAELCGARALHSIRRRLRLWSATGTVALHSIRSRNLLWSATGTVALHSIRKKRGDCGARRTPLQ
jgi:hypothetical protein